MKKEKPAPVCAITAALDVLGGKWKVFILAALSQHGTMRFGALQRQIPKVTQKMLTQQLRELEDAGLVHRRIYAEVPPRVEYSLTPHGLTLRSVLASLREWGSVHQRVLSQNSAPTPCEVVENMASKAAKVAA